MRTVALLSLIALCAPVVSGQNEPRPDTLDWRGYFPLEVGNVWQYRADYYQPANPFRPRDESYVEYQEWRVSGTAVVHDTSYFVLRRGYFTEQGALKSADSLLVRLDTVSLWDEQVACLLARNEAGESCWPQLNLAGDFYAWSAGNVASEREVQLPGEDTLRIAKAIDSYVSGHTFLHGVGLLSWGGGCEPCTPLDDSFGAGIVFARVGGRTYGTAVVAVETGAPPSEAVDLSVFPNPAFDAVQVHTNLRSPADFYLFDLLGRLIRLEKVGAGSQQTTLRLDGMSAGVYLLHLNGQTRTLVVR